VREFTRRLEAAGLTVEPTPGATTASCATASRSAKRTGCPSRCRSRPKQSAGAERRSSNCASSASACSTGPRNVEARRPFGHRASTATRSHPRPALVKPQLAAGIGVTARTLAGTRSARTPMTMASPGTTAIDLYWLPLGAGGHSVRLNGRIFEWFAARLAHRDRCDLYPFRRRGNRPVATARDRVPFAARGLRGVLP
jgi:hypothetical protein